jgi:hypothetical protein
LANLGVPVKLRGVLTETLSKEPVVEQRRQPSASLTLLQALSVER